MRHARFRARDLKDIEQSRARAKKKKKINNDRRANEDRIKSATSENPRLPESKRKSLVTKVARCHSSRLFRLFIAIVWRTGSGTMAYTNGTKSRRRGGRGGQVSPRRRPPVSPLVTSFAGVGSEAK